MALQSGKCNKSWSKLLQPRLAKQRHRKSCVRTASAGVFENVLLKEMAWKKCHYGMFPHVPIRSSLIRCMTAKTSPNCWPKAWINRSRGKYTPDVSFGDSPLFKRRMLNPARFPNHNTSASLVVKLHSVIGIQVCSAES